MIRYEPIKGEAATSDAYTFARYINRNKVPLDAKLPSYIAFSEYIRHQPHNSMKGAMFFEDRDELVEHCKRNSTTFKAFASEIEYSHAIINSAFINNALSHLVAYHSVGDGEVVHLQRADRISVSLIHISRELNHDLAREMIQDTSDVRRLSDLPIERAFVYFDVSDFSGYSSIDQLLIINSLNRFLRFEAFWDIADFTKAALKECEARLCIGDGYIYVFRSAISAAIFAAHLAGLVEAYGAFGKLPVEYHFRMGVDVGKVNCFFDPGRDDWNYIGSGINDAQRILSAIEKTSDDVLYISAAVRQHLIASSDLHYAESLHSCTMNKGRRADKHGNLRRVYEVNYSLFFNNYRPKVSSILRVLP